MKHATIAVFAAAALAVLMTIQPATANAYVGPTAGLSLFSAAAGLLVAIFSAIAIIFLWPIRMLLKWIRGNKSRAAQPSEPPGAPVH